MEILGYLHSLIGNRTEPVRCPRGVAMISDCCGLPTIAELFLSINYRNKSCGDRTIIAVSPYGARSTCLRDKKNVKVQTITKS